MLRNRIDSCQYSTEQLVLGTIFFTLQCFLFPTVAVYYVTFAVVHYLLLFVRYLLRIMVLVLYHFPMYELLFAVRQSDDRKFYFELLQCKGNHVYFALRTQYASFAKYFATLVAQIKNEALV